MVVFKVVRKSDKSLVGYRLDTMGSLGTLEQAKRYSCETDEEIANQKAIIEKNLNTILENSAEALSGRFLVGPILKAVKEEFYPDFTTDDVELSYEIVPDVEVVARVHTIIDSEGVRHF
jgi:hypothetical protein